jgi:hypothetical protein
MTYALEIRAETLKTRHILEKIEITVLKKIAKVEKISKKKREFYRIQLKNERIDRKRK